MRTAPHPPGHEGALPGVPQPGHVIAGKYVVERLLGVGGMGVVVAARHVDLDERVAIKMLLPNVPPQADTVARFVREARAAIKIRSEHVVRVLDVGRLETGLPFIVMEYLDGADLGQHVDSSGPLPVDDAVDYVLQACEAIAAAHALGIVHRDLKPANLFLTKAADGEPCVKVLDFGISKVAATDAGPGTGLTSTATIMGTPCFMSPEQLRSTRDVDGRTDIWSIGAILFALLTGVPPYDGESNADVSAKIIRDPARPLRMVRPDAPADLEAIVLRCLEKHPAARFADVAQLAAALGAVGQRESIKALAARVARVATGAAPTQISTRAASAGAPAGGAAGGTRTASSWGETRSEGKASAQPRVRPWLGVAAGAAVLVAVTVIGVVRLRPASHSTTTVASGSAAPSVASTAAQAAAQPPPPSSASSAVVSAPSAPPTSKAVSPGPTAPGKAVATHPALGTSAKPPGAPPSAPSAKPGAGLFDGRE
jgi:serine/threonine-protein kinase